MEETSLKQQECSTGRFLELDHVSDQDLYCGGYQCDSLLLPINDKISPNLNMNKKEASFYL